VFKIEFIGAHQKYQKLPRIVLVASKWRFELFLHDFLSGFNNWQGI
jgi:hypothetical protein